MTSDETTRTAPDAPYRPRGAGMTIGFKCGKCFADGCNKLGSGMRHVNGLRTYVCKACKEKIDARRKA